jgi:hypothetical protein
MLFRTICISAVALGGLTFVLSAEALSEDWLQKSVAVAGGGTFEFEFPTSWGKKPHLNEVDGITEIRFGPYGPRKKPIFLVHIETLTAIEPVTIEAITEVTDLEIESHKRVAVETDVPKNAIKGPNVIGLYFSITDRSSKIGEFDYMTLAILGSGHLLIKIYFFSSDGAPDFGADAMLMMRSIEYTAPPPEPEGESKKK